VEKIKKAVNYLVTKHRESDGNPEDQSDVEKEKESIKKLNAKADKISQWLDTHEDRIGSQGKPVKSNITDNESAKMATNPDAKYIRYARGSKYLFETHGDRRAGIRKHRGNKKARQFHPSG
jgi:negative regulator of genetic competence, sporulation and motility